jgi:isomerase DpgB
VSELSRLTDAHLRIDAAEPLSAGLIGDLTRICETLENSTKDSRLVVELSGPAAPTSAQLWPDETGIHTVNKWEQALRRLERLPAVTVAVVQGWISGPALDVLLATDYRLSTPDSGFHTPLVGRAAWPGMGLYRLANQLGANVARQLGLLGMRMSADRALDCGLVDEVTADPAGSARMVLDSIGGVSGRELSIRRQLLAEAQSTTYENAVGSHLAACDRALRLTRTGVDAA